MSIEKDLQAVSPAKRIKELEQLVEKQQGIIERSRKARFTLPTGSVRSCRGESHLRVCIPDTHGALIDKTASKAFFNDLELLKPKEIIMLGDHIDCGGFLAQHHVMNYLPQTEYSFEEDVQAGNLFLDRVQKVCPDAEITYIEGNHERRIVTSVIKWTLNHPRDAKYLASLFSPEKVLNLESRGIRYVREDTIYDGLNVTGTINLKGCLARHGTECGKYAAHRTVAAFAKNVIFAHTHQMAQASINTIHGVAYGWSFGCLSQKVMLYGHTDLNNWAHGYGIQAVKRGSGFITIQVPILNGKSYLEVLTEPLTR